MLSAADMNASVGDFQREYLYKLLFPTLPIALPQVFPNAADVAANMDVFTNKFAIPESATNPLKIKWAGEWTWWSGTQDAAGFVVLSCRCDRKYLAYDLCSAWKNLTGDDNGAAAFPKFQCVGVAELLMIDVDKTTVLKKFRLTQAQIMKVEAVDLSKSGDKEVEFNVNLHYERKINLSNNLGSV